MVHFLVKQNILKYHLLRPGTGLFLMSLSKYFLCSVRLDLLHHMVEILYHFLIDFISVDHVE